MKILITGGMGFIGSALATHLVSLGYDVCLTDSLSLQIHGPIPKVSVPEGAIFHRVDIRDSAQHAKLLEGCDVVYHMAAETGTAQSMYRIQDYVSVNEMGTAALLEAIALCSVRPKRVVLASSRSVYGEGAYSVTGSPRTIVQPLARTKDMLSTNQWEPVGPDGESLQAIPTPETLPFSPGSVYAATKASQELLLRSAGEALGFKPIILRFQNVYGEGQSLQNPYTGIISIFYNRARQGKDIPIYEDGLESRDFVHIDDIVAGLIAALTADLPHGATINLGAGEPTSVIMLAQQLLNSASVSVPIKVTGQFRLGDIRHCFADLTQARSLLGFEPKVSLAEGLGRFCNWAYTQPVHEDKLDKATAELRERKLMSE
jgi:dTDP-L-rhamnose 4-epimerase